MSQRASSFSSNTTSASCPSMMAASATDSTMSPNTSVRSLSPISPLMGDTPLALPQCLTPYPHQSSFPFPDMQDLASPFDSPTTTNTREDDGNKSSGGGMKPVSDLGLCDQTYTTPKGHQDAKSSATQAQSLDEHPLLSSPASTGDDTQNGRRGDDTVRLPPSTARPYPKPKPRRRATTPSPFQIPPGLRMSSLVSPTGGGRDSPSEGTPLPLSPVRGVQRNLRGIGRSASFSNSTSPSSSYSSTTNTKSHSIWGLRVESPPKIGARAVMGPTAEEAKRVAHDNKNLLAGETEGEGHGTVQAGVDVSGPKRRPAALILRYLPSASAPTLQTRKSHHNPDVSRIASERESHNNDIEASRRSTTRANSGLTRTKSLSALYSLVHTDLSATQRVQTPYPATPQLHPLPDSDVPGDSPHSPNPAHGLQGATSPGSAREGDQSGPYSGKTIQPTTSKRCYNHNHQHYDHITTTPFSSYSPSAFKYSQRRQDTDQDIDVDADSEPQATRSNPSPRWIWYGDEPRLGTERSPGWAEFDLHSDQDTRADSEAEAEA